MIRFILFYRMDWCEKHPGVMFALLAVLIMLGGALEAVP
jgi:hypothetical protein